MRYLQITYKIPEKLAQKLIKKGINFEGVAGKLLISDYELGEPVKVSLTKAEA